MTPRKDRGWLQASDRQANAFTHDLTMPIMRPSKAPRKSILKSWGDDNHTISGINVQLETQKQLKRRVSFAAQADVRVVDFQSQLSTLAKPSAAAAARIPAFAMPSTTANTSRLPSPRHRSPRFIPPALSSVQESPSKRALVAEPAPIKTLPHDLLGAKQNLSPVRLKIKASRTPSPEPFASARSPMELAGQESPPSPCPSPSAASDRARRRSGSHTPERSNSPQLASPPSPRRSPRLDKTLDTSQHIMLSDQPRVHPKPKPQFSVDALTLEEEEDTKVSMDQDDAWLISMESPEAPPPEEEEDSRRFSFNGIFKSAERPRVVSHAPADLDTMDFTGMLPRGSLQFSNPIDQPLPRVSIDDNGEATMEFTRPINPPASQSMGADQGITAVADEKPMDLTMVARSEVGVRGSTAFVDQQFKAPNGTQTGFPANDDLMEVPMEMDVTSVTSIRRDTIKMDSAMEMTSVANIPQGVTMELTAEMDMTDVVNMPTRDNRDMPMDMTLVIGRGNRTTEVEVPMEMTSVVESMGKEMEAPMEMTTIVRPGSGMTEGEAPMDMTSVVKSTGAEMEMEMESQMEMTSVINRHADDPMDLTLVVRPQTLDLDVQPEAAMDMTEVFSQPAEGEPMDYNEHPPSSHALKEISNLRQPVHDNHSPKRRRLAEPGQENQDIFSAPLSPVKVLADRALAQTPRRSSSRRPRTPRQKNAFDPAPALLAQDDIAFTPLHTFRRQSLAPKPSPKVLFNGPSEPRLALVDFLRMISVEFMDNFLEAGQVRTFDEADSRRFSGSPSLGDFVVAEGKVPMLGLYQFSAQQMSEDIISSKQIVERFDREEGTPAIFQEFMQASEPARKELKAQFALMKALARHQVKKTWYDWRLKLFQGVSTGYRKYLDDLKQDQRAVASAGVEIDARHEAAAAAHNKTLTRLQQLRKRVADLEALDRSQLQNSQQDFVEARDRAVAVKADLSTASDQALTLQTSLNTLETRKAELEAEINKVQGTLEAMREVEAGEVVELKANLEALKGVFGISGLDIVDGSLRFLLDGLVVSVDEKGIISTVFEVEPGPDSDSDNGVLGYFASHLPFYYADEVKLSHRFARLFKLWHNARLFCYDLHRLQRQLNVRTFVEGENMVLSTRLLTGSSLTSKMVKLSIRVLVHHSTMASYPQVEGSLHADKVYGEEAPAQLQMTAQLMEQSLNSGLQELGRVCASCAL